MDPAALHPLLGIEWRQPVLAPTRDEGLEAEAKRRTGGKVPLALGYVGGLEWTAATFLDSLTIGFAHLEPATAQLISLVASHENACRHCYGHRRAVLRIQGYSDEEIRRLEHDLELAELSDRTRAILEFARTLARSRPRPMRDRAQALVARGVTEDEIAEIVVEVANWCMGNRMATMLAVPPEAKLEALADGLLGRLLRPILGRQMKKGLQRVPPMAPVDLTGVPYGDVLEPVAATSVGHMLARSLEGAFDSPVLPRRTKALVFAVVAKNLGCTTCEGASCRILEAEGLDTDRIRAALDHLASPDGDAIEEKVIALARDSVHYRPLEIQDRVRSLADDLGPQRLLEAVGIAALANAIVRIAMLRM